MKRSFFQYVSLNVLGALGLSGYILADTLFVAHRLGTDGLAALNLAISVFGLINGLGLMLGIGGATRYAICRTQGDGVRADRAFSRALACGGTLGGLLALAGLLWAVPLARLLGAEGAILPMCSVYLRTVLLFAPCFLLNHILTAFVRNDGNPKLAMAAMLLGSLSNIVLDYVFLYPMDMGIFGAALATGIAPVVGRCVSSLHILTRRSRFRLRPFRPALRPLADLAGLGSAAFLNECSSGLVLVVFNLLTLRLAGTLGVAASGIVAHLALLALALLLATLWRYRWRTTLKAGVLTLAVAGVVAFLSPPDGQTSRRDRVNWQPLSEQAISDALASNKRLFIDVTADWCVTCKANKYNVLLRDDVQSALSEPDVVALRGDWSRPSAAIGRFLTTRGSAAVPFNQIYGPGLAQGRVLSPLLSRDELLATLSDAKGQ